MTKTHLAASLATALACALPVFAQNVQDRTNPQNPNAPSATSPTNPSGQGATAPDAGRTDASSSKQVDSTTQAAEPTSQQRPNIAPAESGSTAVSAKSYWALHAQNGMLTREAAMQYSAPNNRKIDFDKLDANRDGKVSEQEWTAYHSADVGETVTGKPMAAADMGQRETSPPDNEPPTPKAFWSMHSKGGKMSLDTARRYVESTGRASDMTRLDANRDGEIDQEEWTAYHGVAEDASKSTPNTVAPTTRPDGKNRSPSDQN